MGSLALSKSEKKFEIKDWNKLERSGRKLKRNEGRFLIRPKHTNRDVYIIQQGCVAIYQEGDDTPLAVLSADDVLGNRSIFVHQNLYAKTITDVELIQLDQASYRSLYLAYPELAIKLTTELSKLKLKLDFPEQLPKSILAVFKKNAKSLLNKTTTKKGRYCHNC
ncbi:Crp/Fnr family transcriptional regulator [Guptibacillus algicola]|uniref:Crp/Fnr family transcriptional regulator n=1 Tax=Guptibacillus algicola TaxID=225844 RepID=UPI001CD7199C|nr:cyclic nucleotide-binding domain-containing protein [Alkalihalobacillus algicola]MCA0986736.1 cyclic nucleotide-binding domain-containing protein [Alkalihalobacillus algicola]